MAWSVNPKGLAEAVADACAARSHDLQATTVAGRRVIFEEELGSAYSLESDITEDHRKWFDDWVQIGFDGEDLRALVGLTSLGLICPPSH